MQHHSNRDLTWPMAITNAKQDPQQRQHMQFSRSWCAGYTDGPSESGNLILTSPGTQSNVQQWNQADQTSENSTSLAIRWSSGQNSESRESSPLKYNGVSSALERSGPTKILRQHENLMRSLPHSSSMNRQSNRMTNFGQQEDRIQENWGARLERNSNSNYSAQTHCGVEKVFGEEEVWDESYNKFEQPFWANHLAYQVAQWQLFSCWQSPLALAQQLECALYIVYLSRESLFPWGRHFGTRMTTTTTKTKTNMSGTTRLRAKLAPQKAYVYV